MKYISLLDWSWQLGIYTLLLSKVSNDEPAKREGENDSDHATHVRLRDETAPFSRWDPPGRIF